MGVNNVSISSASKIVGVETHTLRYWEQEFKDHLHPVRTDGGQRRYRPEDIQMLFTIKRLLRDEMFSIAGARKYLKMEQQRVEAYEDRRAKEIEQYGVRGKNGELVDVRTFQEPKFGKQEVES